MSGITAVQTGSGWDVDGLTEVPVKFDTVTGAIPDPAAASAVRGPMPLSTAQWAYVPSISRLRVVGTGALSIDSRNRAGAVASAVFTGTYSATPETIEFPYYGDSAVQIRATFPATLTVEVI